MNLAFAPLRVIIILLRLTCFTNVLVDSFPNCSYLLTLGTYWKHILDRSSNSFIHLIVNNIHDSKLYNFAKTCIYSKTLNIPSVDVRWRWYRPTRQIKYMNRITSVLTQNHQSKQQSNSYLQMKKKGRYQSTCLNIVFTSKYVNLTGRKRRI